MGWRFSRMAAVALAAAAVNASAAMAEVTGKALPEPSSVRAYGPSPYYMPDLSQTPPPPAFRDVPPTYYTGGGPRAAAPASPAYGPSPYYMPDLSRPPSQQQQAIGSSPYYMPDLSRQPMAAPQPLAGVQPPAGAAPGKTTVEKITVAEAGKPAHTAEKNDVEENFNDPLEPLNRFFFGFNEYLEKFLFSHIITAYNWLPVGVRGSVTDFLDNINSPVVLANDLLQFEFLRAWQTTERVVINTTLGVGGLFDVAESEFFNIPKHKEDFGQTLGKWGVGEMFYVVLPLFGPTSPRDAVGTMFVDGYFDPVGYWLKTYNNSGSFSYEGQNGLALARTAVSAVDKYASVKSELDTIRNTSIDFYATIRSMYRQKRDNDIANGKNGQDLLYDMDRIELQ